MLNVVLCL
jgi:hypothetical protein